MLRLVFAIAATIAAVTFAMANTHQVELSLVFGSPAHLNLIFLLMVTFMLGMVVASIFGMLSRLRLKRRLHVELERRLDEMRRAESSELNREA